MRFVVRAVYCAGGTACAYVGAPALAEYFTLSEEFLMPIVGDALHWKDDANKRLGYSLQDGSKNLPLRLTSGERRKPGKAPAP
jgi:hypothetical protein